MLKTQYTAEKKPLVGYKVNQHFKSFSSETNCYFISGFYCI